MNILISEIFKLAHNDIDYTFNSENFNISFSLEIDDFFFDIKLTILINSISNNYEIVEHSQSSYPGLLSKKTWGIIDSLKNINMLPELINSTNLFIEILILSII
jgi:hypothetical protein